MKNRSVYLLSVALVLCTLSSGCASRKRNTAQTRWYHAFVVRFNTGFNGQEAYKKGYKEQVNANKDNYIEPLPWLVVGNEETRKAGAGSYKRAVEKAQKSIKQHSIKKKPVRKAGQRLSEKEKRFYAQKEFNPYLYRAWFLMGKAYFQQGEFLEASSTYSYMMRLYAGNPVIVQEARIRMAQCYTELEWFYEAEDLLMKARRDSIPHFLRKDLAGAYANFYLKQERYAEALPYLEEAVRRKGRNKKEKAREYYLLGQVYQRTEQPESAFKAYQRAIRTNPPYELEFNSRIRQTETVHGKKEVAGMIKKLTSMSKNPKNENYLDQLYYAKGNIYLAQSDTAHAIENYEKGLEESKSSFAKKALLWQLAQIYWSQGKYGKAQPCYSQLVGLLTKEDAEFKEVEKRSKALESLVVHTNNVELQDSLQYLATLPEEELNKVVDALIEEVIKKEEEEKKRAEEAENMARRDEALNRSNGGKGTPAGLNTSTASVGSQDKTAWYFYNPVTVEQGKASFLQKWGKRKPEDNWRRQNKTVLDMGNFAETDYSEPSDSLQQDSTLTVAAADTTGTEEATDTLSTDPHTREFYLQQIPITEEQMTESDNILSDALYNTGLIAKDELEDKAVSEKAFARLQADYPDFEKMEEVYYQLFLLYSLWDEPLQAAAYKDSLQALFPEGKYTLTICDPDFEHNALYGKHLEDSLYARTYSGYRNGEFETVRQNETYAKEKYPMGRHRPKFMFLDAMSRLQMGEKEGFLERLKEVVTSYPQDEISELAGLIAQGLQEGRLLGSGSFGSIWERRKGSAMFDSIPDSTAVFSAERYVPFLFVLAYPQDSLNENQLLFEMARYNFTNYMVRNFDMEFVHDNGIGMLRIKEFLNFDEAYMYMKRLYSEAEMARKLTGLRALVISKANLDLLMSLFSFADYDDFYKQNFLKIPEPEIKGYTLDEPTEDQLPEEE